MCTLFNFQPDVSSNEQTDDTFEEWSIKRAPILSKYTTSEKLSITTSFLSQNSKDLGLFTLIESMNITYIILTTSKTNVLGVYSL